MSARNNARHVRQRKLNTKQGLRIIREADIEDAPDDESQRNIPHVETGVEKGEEVEFHLQALISAAAGPKSKDSYIPTPDAVKARDVDYNELYPETFSSPATYIRFGATVEDSIGVGYCMNRDDVEFVAKLNAGRDVEGRDRKDRLTHCSDDVFEEVMTFFEETSARVQPFAALDNAPIMSMEEMEQAVDDNLSAEGRQWIKLIFPFWVLKKGVRPLMPAIKVRVLDTTSEADDADPYICFRRREVRQTRKTRGRDAQIVEKLKKLRLELEQARNLVLNVARREQLNKENLEISRKVFDERRRLKEVKATKNIAGDKDDDEDLLVNQKPVTKPKTRPEVSQPRPSTIRVRSGGPERSAPDTDLDLLSERQAEAETYVNTSIENRKEQHTKWNHHWVDNTWWPLTPPPEDSEARPRWAPLVPEDLGYPTPPPSLPSVSRQASEAKDADVDMPDALPPPRPSSPKNIVADVASAAAAEHLPRFNIFHDPGQWPQSPEEDGEAPSHLRRGAPACRLRYGRGGRCFLESRKRRPRAYLNRGVVSDSDSDDDDTFEYFPVPESHTFEYRGALNSRARPDGMGIDRRHWPSGDQSSMMSGHTPSSSASHMSAQHLRPDQAPPPSSSQQQPTAGSVT